MPNTYSAVNNPTSVPGHLHLRRPKTAPCSPTEWTSSSQVGYANSAKAHTEGKQEKIWSYLWNILDVNTKTKRFSERLVFCSSYLSRPSLSITAQVQRAP